MTVLSKTCRLCACAWGENSSAALLGPGGVYGIWYCGVLICGALAGVGGAYLSLDQLDMFVRNMTAGRGYIAVAIAILGRYNPAQIVPCALLFGFCDAVQIYLQGEAFPPSDRRCLLHCDFAGAKPRAGDNGPGRCR